MKPIKVVRIPEMFVNAIKKQALSSENEIYGWLIGYQRDDIPNVLANIECKRFEQQTLISAIPSVQEFQEISSLMPQGIGPIGIYHSHPFSSEVFHSHVDDSTLLSLSNQFSNCISIVTNGKKVNCYQLGKNSKIDEIGAEYVESQVPKLLLFSLNEIFLVKINKNVLNDSKNVSALKSQILNEFSDYFEFVWNDLELFARNSKVSKSNAITSYLTNKLSDDPIKLKIPIKLKAKNKVEMFIKRNNEQNSNSDLIGNMHESFYTELKIKVPIYITMENKNFMSLSQIVKTELISNNLLQKIFNSVIDFNKRKIIFPDDYYVNYLGFYIRVPYFKRKNSNKNEFSRKIFEFISRIVSQFDYFTNVELSDNLKNQIQIFFKGVQETSKHFSWYQDIKKKLDTLEKNMINNKKKFV